MHSTKHFPSIKRLFYHMLFVLGTVAYPKKWTTQPKVFPAGGGGGGSPPTSQTLAHYPPPLTHLEKSLPPSQLSPTKFSSPH